MALLIAKHTKFFSLCLHTLPQKAQSEDTSKLAFAYFALHGLALIGKLDSSFKTPEHVQFVYNHLIPLQDTSMQAFRPSMTFALEEGQNGYDLPYLSATFFALAVLLVLEEDYSTKLDRHKIMKFVSACQIKSGANKGSFLPVLGPDGAPFGDTDLRLCYIATSIRTMMGYDKLPANEREHDIDVDALQAFVLDKVNFNGGLASYSHTESHSGLTFCGIAALKLIGYKFSADDHWTQLTIDWLVHRQVDFPNGLADYEYFFPEDVGGFNGRENKLADTCYSWWVIASLKNLTEDGTKLVNEDKIVEYLLTKTQHKLMGGFAKDTEAFPDPFHSFLGLASLALLHQDKPILHEGFDQLEPIDPELVITQASRDFLNSIWN